MNATRISDLGIGTAQAQSISPEVWDTTMLEMAARDREIERLTHRLENQARTIKSMEATIGRMVEVGAIAGTLLEKLRDGTSAHALILAGEIVVSRRQLAHLLGDPYQDLFRQLEEKVSETALDESAAGGSDQVTPRLALL